MTDQNPLRETTFALTDGAGAMPATGFGTLIRDPIAAKRAIKAALAAGFRHLDCAELYGNEDVVGVALKESIAAGTVRRDQVFVTTKLWNTNHRPDRVGPALEASLRRLQLDWLDCYLIHTPFAFPAGDDHHPRDADGRPQYDTGVTLEQTWRAMERLVDAGKCRAIGLSDIRLETLKAIVAIARIKPAVVQVEAHPYLPEWDLLDYCRAQGIVLLAFAPLGHGMAPRVTDDPVIAAIAAATGQTASQVALAWAVQRGTAMLTTSTNPDHIRENFAFSALSDQAMQAMRHDIATQVRFNAVVETGVPGFVPRPV